ncbi:TniB family NTP-binding protein [Gloeothece verrucosa]|uniref:TniB family protein n=1 Tax=Gloeothece verrucosa (strain PCC 7822) TaxID=497965 RepID=E0UM52_GLOV7|nr:TniB family NTP-binding protein [Gloeothece verrucosa]ADN18032.1 TniB family protein [Gloeothece verrucosa PCC 7822]
MVEKEVTALMTQEVLNPLKSVVEDETISEQIQRLQRRVIVQLEQMKSLHEWLDGKKLSRQACRVVGESRTGKSVACNAYRLLSPPVLKRGEPPSISVVYWQSSPESGPGDLFKGILDYLKYQLSRGTVSEMRERVYLALEACQVEMVIIDEAHRLRSQTFAEIRDIFDKLEISVVLVGTDRLDAVVRRDEQVYHRFMSCHRFQRMNPRQLAQTSVIWEERVLKLPSKSNLGNSKMQRILAPATRGYIGILDMILREAAIRSLKKGEAKISESQLKEVVGEYK